MFDTLIDNRQSDDFTSIAFSLSSLDNYIYCLEPIRDLFSLTLPTRKYPTLYDDLLDDYSNEEYRYENAPL